MPEHTFPQSEKLRQFNEDMRKRTNEATIRGHIAINNIGPNEAISIGEAHYRKFLARIQTRNDFHKEMTGKLEAVIDSGYPLPIDKKDISELVTIMAMDTLGDPQYWPPK